MCKLHLTVLTLLVAAVSTPAAAQTSKQFSPGIIWKDTQGEVINAHGGGVLFSRGTYYWYGEKRGQRASEGVNVYSSKIFITGRPKVWRSPLTNLRRATLPEAV